VEARPPSGAETPPANMNFFNFIYIKLLNM
jgi:hypothetical protein